MTQRTSSYFAFWLFALKKLKTVFVYFLQVGVVNPLFLCQKKIKTIRFLKNNCIHLLQERKTLTKNNND